MTDKRFHQGVITSVDETEDVPITSPIVFVLKRTHTNNTSDSLNEENIFRFVSVATLGILSMKSLKIPKG